jgi:hypothetical protein
VLASFAARPAALGLDGRSHDPAGALRPVRDLLNARDFDEDTDGLAAPRDLADWLVANGLATPGLTVAAGPSASPSAGVHPID